MKNCALNSIDFDAINAKVAATNGIHSGTEDILDIEPIADRLLVFWSDILVHSVLPSHTPAGENFNSLRTLFIHQDLIDKRF